MTSKKKPLNKYFSEFIKTYPQYSLGKLGDFGRESWSGGYDTNFNLFTQMATPPESKLSYDDIKKAIASRIKIDLRIPRCDAVTGADVRLCPIVPKSFSGLITSKLFGDKRGDAGRYTATLAEKWFNIISQKVTPCLEFYAVGARFKSVNLNKVGPTATRIVCMTEDIINRIGGAFVNKWSIAIRNIRNSAIFIGQSHDKGGYLRVRDVFQKGRAIGCGSDWSSFDCYVYEELIVSALALVRASFPRSQFTDRVFLYICSSLVFKFIVLPGGFIYRFSKGLPSGHPMTSIIGTIINWILWSHIISKMYNYNSSLINKTRLMVMGDDSFVRLVDTRLNKKVDSIIKETGMKCESMYDSIGPLHSTDDEYAVKFLKKKFDHNGYCSWRYQDLYTSLLYPEKLQTSNNEINRVKGMLYTAPFSSRATRMLIDYRRFLPTKVIEGLPEQLKTMVYNHYMKGIQTSVTIAMTWFTSHRIQPYERFRGDDDWISSNKRVITDYTFGYRPRDIFDDIMLNQNNDSHYINKTYTAVHDELLRLE